MKGVAAQLGAFIVMVCKPGSANDEPEPSTSKSAMLEQIPHA